jgi:hypothetical protein
MGEAFEPAGRRRVSGRVGLVLGAVVGTSIGLHAAMVACPIVGEEGTAIDLAAASIFCVEEGVRLPPRFVSPEPLRPITWLHSAWLAPEARLRATLPLEPSVVQRFAEVYRRTLALFPGYVGQSPQLVGPLDLRLVDLDLLNDPTCFDIEVPGRLHGIYFPDTNVAYVTPTATADASHLVHELGHFLYDEYAVDPAGMDEESAVEALELCLRDFELLLAFRHVHRTAPAWVDAAVVWPEPRRVAAGVWFQSIPAVPPGGAAWLGRAVETARDAFPALAERAAPPAGELTVRLLDREQLCPAAALRLRGVAACDAQVLLADRSVVVTPRVYAFPGILGHALGHVLARDAGIAPGSEEEEVIAYALATEVARRMDSAAESSAGTAP